LKSSEDQYKKYLLDNPGSGLTFEEWSKNISLFAKKIYIGSEGEYSFDVEYPEQIIDWPKLNLISKIRNYYNKYFEINGTPPSKRDFNEFLDGINRN
jgi:hypothetical protein